MKIALVGYGKMGRMLDQLAPEFDCHVVLKLDEHNNQHGAAITKENFAGVDVAVEFSTPDSVVSNIERLATIGVDTVVGSTGWYEHIPRVRSLVDANAIGLVWSANFSVGVNVMFRLAAEAAELLAQESEYGAWAWEIHHDAKKDAPSGTLIQLVDRMRQSGYSRPIDTSSNRAGKHPGTHQIGFDSAADTITLTHVARSREGFARGALKAARWIHGKRGMFEFSETLFGGSGQ